MIAVTIVLLVLIFLVMIRLIRSLGNHRKDRNYGRYFGQTEERHGPDHSFRERTSITSEEAKGRAGEQTLYSFIARTQRSGARILQNCWLRFANGTVTEADLILIYRSGIYVIESKNYNSCWIFGSSDDRNWTRTWLNRKDYEKQSRKFYNPLEQNRVHTECISDIVADIDVPIYSIIAFSDKCELKRVPARTAYSAVINYRDLQTTIAEFLKAQPKRIPIEDVGIIYDRLSSCSAGVTEEEKRRHDDLIRDMKEEPCRS